MLVSLTLITAGTLASGGWGYYRMRQSAEAESTNNNGSDPKPSPKEQKVLFSQFFEPIKQLYFLQKKEDNSHKQFLSWATQELGSARLGTWLKELSEEALIALTREISNFCSQLGGDLNWLLESQLNQEPELKEPMTEIVLNYLSACYHAAQAWNDIGVFMILKELESELPNKKYQEEHGELYTRLVEHKLAAPAPSGLFLAEDQKRYSYIMQEIMKAMQTDRQAFKRVVKELLTNPAE
jgi:hypothetical protein